VKAWQWRQANGALRDMVCRGMLLMLERAGHITLPPVSYVRHNPLAHKQLGRSRFRSTPRRSKTSCATSKPLVFEQVRPHQQGAIVQQPDGGASLSRATTQPVGEHLKYLVWTHGRPIACVAWSSAPRHIAVRDRYIGWSAEGQAS